MAMSQEDSVADLGRALDGLGKTIGAVMQRAGRVMQRASIPHVTAEGRRLTEDLSREGYDVVGRSDVRVERVAAETTDGEAAHVRYHDGSEWSDVARYDLTEIGRSLEGEDEP